MNFVDKRLKIAPVKISPAIHAIRNKSFKYNIFLLLYFKRFYKTVNWPLWVPSLRMTSYVI